MIVSYLDWSSVYEFRIFVNCHVDEWQTQQERDDPDGDHYFQHPAKRARILGFQGSTNGVVPGTE